MENKKTLFRSRLFTGIEPEDLGCIMNCLSYRVADVKKGQIVVFEDQQVRHVGIVLSGTVDMVKEDVWGNKTLLVRMGQDEVFGETFAWGDDSQSAVTFIAEEDGQILFMPFNKVMNSCTNACEFHHQLTRNMVQIIANKNRDLLRKVEVVSKKTLREKILSYLSMQAQIQGSRYVQIPLDRQELADYLCADRTALSRELSAMQKAGLIDYHLNTFRLL